MPTLAQIIDSWPALPGAFVGAIGALIVCFAFLALIELENPRVQRWTWGLASIILFSACTICLSMVGVLQYLKWWIGLFGVGVGVLLGMFFFQGFNDLMGCASHRQDTVGDDPHP